MTKEEAKKRIQDLIHKYESLPDYYVKTFNEGQTKKNFIEPFFEALGWDVRSEEVQVEENVAGGRADYAFKLNGITKFYVEVKPLRANLEKEEYKEQLIEYAYNKDINWGILTNFESLKIFNALEKTPSPINFTHNDYLKDFDILWLVSKESFETGEIDTWAERLGIKSIPVPPVGKQLARDLVGWRDSLTYYINQWYKKDLSQEEITEMVQKFLDRLIFIRVTEDRGLENNQLFCLIKDSNNLSSKLNNIFKYFLDHYDSDLFINHPLDRLSLDGIAQNIAKIIRGMYRTKDDKPYNFSFIDADILGSVYEQYLGTVQKKETEKSMRKGQGIYYTPKYIVNYIVQNTLGKLLRESVSSISEAKALKILDPACGSGSFLVKAFEILNKFYEKADVNEETRRKIILKENLYGVDLDPKAIELTQLNLMLAAAEKRELLPELRENVKVGNSLISGTEKNLKKYFGEDWEEKRPFNWKEKLKEVFRKKEGFDVIIGNPPYLSVKRGLPHKEVGYYKAHYVTAQKQFDIFEIFIERSIQLLKPGGRLGFIIPKPVLINENMAPLREFILKNSELELIADVGRPFEDANVENIVLILKKTANPRSDYLITIHQGDFVFNRLEELQVSVKEFLHRSDYAFTISMGGKSKLLQKITKGGIPLNAYFDSIRGVEVGKKDKSIERTPGRGLKPLLRGEDVIPYQCMASHLYIRPSGDTRMFKEDVLYNQPLKILVRRVGSRLISAPDESRSYVLNTLYVLRPKRDVDPFFIVGVLNSKVVNFWFKKTFILEDKLFPYIRVSQLAQIPVPDQTLLKKNVSTLAKKRYEIGKVVSRLAPGTEKYTQQSGKLKELEKQIDQLVYKLYDLTPEEIKIVEKN